MKKRVDFIDSAKGLAICLMVLGHCGYEGSVRDFIYTFHMPLFFILSGVFLGKKDLRFSESLKKNAKSLLIPYMFIYLVTIPFGLAYIKIKYQMPLTIVDCLVKPVIGMLYGVDHVVGECYFFTNGPLWFLLALFLSKVVFDVLHHTLYAANRRVAGGGYLLASLLSLCLYVCLSTNNLNIWSVAQAALLFPYLLIGFMLGQIGLINIIKEAKVQYKIIIASVILPCIWFSTSLLGHIDYNGLMLGTYPALTMLVAVLGTLSIMILLSAIRALPLVVLGQETLVILGFHHPVMDVIKYSMSIIGQNNYSSSFLLNLIVSSLTIFSCHVVFILLKNKVPFLIGK